MFRSFSITSSEGTSTLYRLTPNLYFFWIEWFKGTFLTASGVRMMMFKALGMVPEADAKELMEGLDDFLK